MTSKLSLRGLLPVLTLGFATTALSAQARVFDHTSIELAGGSGLDSFGRSVHIDGDTLLIGANGVDNSGGMFEYTRVAGNWTFDQQFSGDDTVAGDFFGFHFDVDGDLMAVTAEQHDSAALQGGAVHVFEKAGGDWSELVKIVAPDPDDFDRFGSSVAIAGDLLVAGCSADDVGGFDTGSAYVFRRSGSVWNFEQKLSASTADGGDQFGWDVETDGTSILVCAIEDEEGPDATGAIFRFEHDGASWQEEQRFVAGDAEDGDRFGWDIDLEGDVLMVGATEHGAGGAVYVYERTGDDWTFEDKLQPSKLAAGDSFGWSVSVNGQSLAVGAVGTPGDPPNASGSGDGAVYLYHHNGSEWIEVLQGMSGTLHTAFPFVPNMGMSCSTDGESFVAGAPFASGAAANDGVVYVFPARDLGLESVPDEVATGEPFQFDTSGGLPGDVMGYFLVGFGGFSTTVFLGSDVFDADGHTFFPAVALPALSGFEARFLAAGYWQPGWLGFSNIVTVSFL